MEHRRMMQADAAFPFVDGHRVFTHTNELTITNGHIVRIKHPNVSYSVFFNLTDINAMTSDESLSENGKSNVPLFNASAGDIISWVITPVIFNVNSNSTLNFAIRNTEGTAFVVPIETTFKSVQQGLPFIGKFVLSEDVTIANVSTYHAYERNKPYDVEWNLEIYVNGRRIV